MGVWTSKLISLFTEEVEERESIVERELYFLSILVALNFEI